MENLNNELQEFLMNSVKRIESKVDIVTLDIQAIKLRQTDYVKHGDLVEIRKSAEEFKKDNNKEHSAIVNKIIAVYVFVLTTVVSTIAIVKGLFGP